MGEGHERGVSQIPSCASSPDIAHSNPYMKATVVGVFKDDIQYLTNMKTSTAQKVLSLQGHILQQGHSLSVAWLQATPTNYAWDYEMIFEVCAEQGIAWAWLHGSSHSLHIRCHQTGFQ